MKKIIYIFSGLVCVLLLTALIIKLNDKEKKSYVERYNENSTEELSSDKEALHSDSDEGINDSQRELVWKNIKIEIISYDVVDDKKILEQTKYAKENFKHEVMPIADITEEYTDVDAICEISPELKELYAALATSGYVEGAKEVFQENADLIDEYTYEIPVDMKYVFVKCRVTNTTDNYQDIFFNELATFAVAEDGNDWNEWDFEDMYYFDNSVNTEGDARTHQFFRYVFAPNETMECTFGFLLHEIDNAEYYFGKVDNTYYETNESPAKCKSVVKLNKELMIHDDDD